MNKATRTKLRRLSARQLVLSYLAIIMTMSGVFSIVLYVVVNNHADNRAESLALELILLNVAVLFVGAGFSYWLARRTLRPIEKTLNKQEQYIADASHELITPLASTLLSNEVALKNSELTLLQAKAILKDNVKDMQDLQLLSDGLLRESENQSTAVQLTTVDTRHITEEAAEKLVTIARQKKTIINNTTSPLSVTTDANALRKVLVILIENAIKYSPVESTITVANRHSESSVDIIVTDQGTGIDADDLNNIFDRFYRADNSRSQVAGYGLGLSIAKTLLETIGGTISVQSILGAGSEFTISLPMNTDNLI